MLHLYVLYACVYLVPGKHAPQAVPARCVERQIFFRANQCRQQLPEGGRLIQKSRHSRSWLECEETTADSWLPLDVNDRSNRVYKAEASATDSDAVAALLAPLSLQARATLQSGDLSGSFQRSFQGPGRFSFFIVGTGSSVVAFAVRNLDDFQFAQLAADVSSASEATSVDKDLDFATMAEDAGVQLSYDTQAVQRTLPPPGGMEAKP